MPIFAGCDIGSTTGKIVLMDENKTQAPRAVRPICLR